MQPDTSPTAAASPGAVPSALERWLARHLADGEGRHLGSGWVSGVLAVFLGVLGCGAVLVLHFPGWLSSAELRAAYPLPLMRALIDGVIGLGFLCACLNLLLRRRKLLGFIGLGLTGLAILLGGAAVEIDDDFSGAVYLGLDWFLLSLLVLALVFVPLERLFPQHPEQGVFRFGWATDSAHFAVSHLAVQVLTLLTLWPASTVSAQLLDAPWREAIGAQPLLLQLLAIMLVADLTQYWVHRAFHVIPWLWPFHAVHHSSRALDWLAGSRLHVVEVVITRSLVLVPLFVLGFAQPALYAWLVIIGLHAVFIHGNLRWRLGWIEPLLATPRFHHWHHAVAPVDRNFAVHFPWLDRLFGTHHMPGDQWPPALGIKGDPVPEGFLAQLAWPFRRP
jgi:sterol desaturase/sphingolipid hydroxylase (fatty acid hydroxylase superfamily)